LIVTVKRRNEPLSNVRANISLLALPSETKNCYFLNNDFSKCYKSKKSYKELCIEKGYNFSDALGVCFENMIIITGTAENTCSLYGQYLQQSASSCQIQGETTVVNGCNVCLQ